MAMELIFGPPGSGKTSLVMRRVRERLGRGDAGFRLVTPTATMAEHLSNQLAREGLCVRPRCVVTIAGLTAEAAPEAKAVGEADLVAVVEQGLDALRPRSLAASAVYPGLARELAKTFEELAAAGCDATYWAALGQMRIWRDASMGDLGRLYDWVEAELSRRGGRLRPQVIGEAASALRRAGLEGCEEILFDGFFTFSPAEIALLGAAAKHHRLTVTLPEWPGAEQTRERLLGLGLKERRCQTVRTEAERVRFQAPNKHREAEEIARRILQIRDAGTPLSEIGVIVRSTGAWGRLVEETLERFGVAVRSYLVRPLHPHPVARGLASAARAVMNEWETGAALELLDNPSFEAGRAAEWGRFYEQAVGSMPGRGLGVMLRLLTENPALGGDQSPIAGVIRQLMPAEQWSGTVVAPKEWARRLKSVLELIARPGDPGPLIEQSEERLVRGRAQAAWAAAEALDRAAEFLGDEPVGLEPYWRHAWRTMETVSLTPDVRRRDAVAVLDAYEARQWELPVVFVCGLVEGEFPRHSAAEPLLSDALRRRISEQGLPLRTRASKEREERFLLDLALSRANRTTLLSHPRYDEKGEQTLPSFALDGVAARAEEPVRVRVKPWRQAGKGRLGDLTGQEALEKLRTRRTSFQITSLETQLECPFIFHARYNLPLEQLAARPEERLDVASLGQLVHQVIAEYHKRGPAEPIERVFASVWRRRIERDRVPFGFHSEYERLRALRALRYYARNTKVEPGARLEFEKNVAVEMDGGWTLKGRIDRVDRFEDGRCRVVDFKYSGSSGRSRLKRRSEAGVLLQLGLYVRALQSDGLRPEWAAYAPLRTVEPWLEFDEPDTLAERAADGARRAIGLVSAGVIGPNPVDADMCNYCELAAACRIAEIKLTAEEQGRAAADESV